ncbi:MAG: hypothetical protein EA400_03255 [Chromatiaceae bacterium]|nr:MAG: hypothetical protein EA400_03255 [Chromatiaceae bacterium]
MLVPVLAADLLDTETRALLVDAVEAAFALDRYNARCRSDQSGRRTENLNKALTSRFRITVIGVQDDLFPERDYRSAQARMQQQFLEQLRAFDGCAGAKVARWRETLGARYDEAMAGIAALP